MVGRLVGAEGLRDCVRDHGDFYRTGNLQVLV